MIAKQTFEQFLEELGSNKPTPGGGAVAALSAAMAAGLVQMVVNLTKGDSIKPLGEKSQELEKKLVDLADADVAAFDAVMHAYHSKNKGLIRDALKQAIVVPGQTKEYACLVEEIAKVVEKEGNKNAVSDARTAIHLAQAAQKSAQENIDINKDALAKLG